MKYVNIKLWDILGCFHYILNAPRNDALICRSFFFQISCVALCCYMPMISLFLKQMKRVFKIMCICSSNTQKVWHLTINFDKTKVKMLIFFFHFDQILLIYFNIVWPLVCKTGMKLCRKI